MRLNQFIAQVTGISRRKVDEAIINGRIEVNGQPAKLGQQVEPSDKVTIDSRAITPAVKTLTLILNKPVGYVCSRDGQGSKTIYDLLPPEFHHLKPVGRLDKDSSGLLLLTNNGQLAHQLTHPSFQKEKVYEVEIDHPLSAKHKAQIKQGVKLEDGISKLNIRSMTKDKGHKTDDTRQIKKDIRHKTDDKRGRDTSVLRPMSYVLSPMSLTYLVAMHEGRNRQIRRTFEAAGYRVTKLHRTQFGTYSLGQLPIGQFHSIT